MYSYYMGEIYLENEKEYAYLIHLLEDRGWIKKTNGSYCWVDEEGEPIEDSAFYPEDNRLPINAPFISDIHIVVKYVFDNFHIDPEKTKLKGYHINNNFSLVEYRNQGLKRIENGEAKKLLGADEKTHPEDLESLAKRWVENPNGAKKPKRKISPKLS